MRDIRAVFLRLLNLFRRNHLERELAEELDAHLHLHIEDNVRSGMTPDRARRQAILALGGIEPTKERYRDRRGLPVLEMFLQDVRFGIRGLRKSPAFTFGAVSALTIGVGVNVIIFSVANALILRPLPVVDPDRLVRVYTNGYSNTLYPAYLDYRDRNQTLSSLAAFDGVSLFLRIDGSAEPVAGVAVSGNYFATLGVSAASGRVITEMDDRAGVAGVVVLSEAYRRRRFGADSTVVGRAIVVNGHPFTIVGIAPRAFTGTQSPVTVDVWVPWNAPGLPPQGSSAGGGRSAHLIGRLLPGVTLAQAQADTATVGTSAANRSGGDRTPSLTLYPARTLLPQMSNLIGTFVGLLTAVAALVLLVACANIAGLLIARAEGRRREIAVRLALGASRRRLIAQLLTESLILSSLAAVAGSVLAVLAARVAARVTLPVAEPIALDLTIDWRVMIFTAGLSLLTTILFGLVPAAQSSKVTLLPGLRDGATATAGRGRTWIRGALVLGQVTLSTLLVMGAGVLVRSVTHARAIDLGFSSDRILFATVDVSTLSYPRERGIDFFEQVRARLGQDSRVANASFVGTLPLTVSSQALGFVKEGAASLEPHQRVPQVFFDSVSAGYFRTVGIPLLAGRDFGASDSAGAPQVAIVNETLASRFWPGENPLGQKLRGLGPRNLPGPPIEVVGLARNAKYATVGEDAKMFVYLPFAQEYTSRVTLLVKTEDDPRRAIALVRAAVQNVDPDVAVFRVGTLDEATRVSLLPVQVAAALAAALGLIALALAAIGIYAMTTYLVRQRTREVGIRLALGARPSELVRALTREGLRWTIAGLVLGLGASLAATRLLRSLLYDVGSTDPVAFIAVPGCLLLAAYVACRAPASAASRIDPLRALREE